MAKAKVVVAFIVIIIVVISALLTFIFLNMNNPAFLIMDGFEQGSGEIVEGWTIEADVPLNPNDHGDVVEFSIRRVSNISYSGNYSALFFIDGTQDDGTIWLERKINMNPNTQTRVNMSLWFYSETESFNTLAAIVAYAGSDKPDVEEDFAVIGNTNEVAGWKNYAYNTDFSTNSDGEVYVAFCISVRWETQMTFYIDDITIP